MSRTRLAAALLALHAATGLKEQDFRKCSDTPFCQLHRKAPEHGFQVEVSSVAYADGVLTARLHSPESPLPLQIALSVLGSGAVRVRIAEDEHVPLEALDRADPAVPKPEEWDDEMDGEWVAPRVRLGRAVKGRFVPEDSFASAAAAAPSRVHACAHSTSAEASRLRCEGATGAPAEVVEVELRHAPLVVAVHVGGVVVALLNGRQALRFEHFREQRASEMAEAPAAREAHSFGRFTDPLPFGSSSVGLDLAFPRASHAYGLPERTVAHALPPTLGKEPYRLFNLDVFEYELDHPMSVYGAVPFLHAHGEGGSYGALWLNPSETFVDLGCPSTASEAGGEAAAGGAGVCSHWFSASGAIDAFVFAGAAPRDVSAQHAALTGVTPLPPLFALGYHQCRWNYKDEEDVAAVHARFDAEALPLDVLWLDIEHTDRKRYFTWNEDFFPDPARMQQALARTGRKMVTIIDPHLRAEEDYAVFAEAKARQLLVRSADNASHFEGDCWPGRSAWVDYLQPAAREYWASRFAPAAYAGSSATLYTWNDMNEPSVFDGPEITMPPTLLHHDAAGRAYEHRELHNMYGLLMTIATQRGQRDAYPARRPFVLTRAFFSGSQRYAAVWTGDNKASWAHLAASTPMLLSLSVAGLPFVGADVGGFFGNPTPALLVRWYQAAVFHPFLRAHAEFKTKRREPYLFGAEVTRQVREALRLRYALLPYLYTLFADHAADGALVMRPLWHEFPRDPHVRAGAWWAPETPAGSAAAAKEEEEGEEGERLGAAGEEEGAEDGTSGKAAVAAAGSGPGGGACDCYKCDAQPCYAPHCSSCGPKATSGCRMVNGNAYPPWGCYREQEAPCQCRAAPKYDRGARGGYGHGRGGGRRRGEEYDDEEEEEEEEEEEYARRGRFDEELPEEEAEEVGECPCHWCSGERCHPPACEVCGTKEASQCVKPDGSTAEWGCYTSAAAECSCNASPYGDGGRYSRYGEAGGDDEAGGDYRYDRYGREHRASEYDDDDEYAADDDEYRRGGAGGEDDDAGGGGGGAD